MLSLYEAGVSRAYWFTLEQGLFDTPADIPPPWTPNVASLYGYGDYGLLSSGQCDADTGYCEPPAHTPFPSYFGMQMTSRLAQAGTKLLEASSTDEMVRVHAARTSNGRLAVMIINQDPCAERRVSLDIAGAQRARLADVESFAAGDARPSRHPRQLPPHATISVAPYSITTLTFRVR
jgi:hypothetical protein